MSKICHARCPDESGALLAAVLAVILTAVLAVIAAQVIESLFAAIMITGSVLIAAGCGLFAYLIRRDRWTVAQTRERVLTGVVVRVQASRPAESLSAARPRAIEGCPAKQMAPGRSAVSVGRARSRHPGGEEEKRIQCPRP